MEKEKYVDESWKESASKEKDNLENTKETNSDNKATQSNATDDKISASNGKSDKDITEDPNQETTTDAIEINFLNYITSLGFQAMIFLGIIPNPISNQVEKSLDQAKLLIDTLSMLKDKTKGNLTKQEEDMLNSTVYELQMKYIEMINAKES